MVTPQEAAQFLHRFIEAKLDVQTQQRYRTTVSMQKIPHHVLQFVDCTKNLWRQGQCWMERVVGDQEH